jgi:AraC-like DNA-binding protein
MANRKYGTVEYFIEVTWTSLNQRTINGKNPRHNCRKAKYYLDRKIELRMTRKEFADWCWKHSKIIKKLYRTKENPSLERLDANKHYSFNNISIIPVKINSALNRSGGKKVFAVSELGGRIETHSVKELAELIGANRSHLSSCLKKQTGKANGYVIGYLNQIDIISTKLRYKAFL